MWTWCVLFRPGLMADGSNGRWAYLRLTRCFTTVPRPTEFVGATWTTYLTRFARRMVFFLDVVAFHDDQGAPFFEIRYSYPRIFVWPV